MFKLRLVGSLAIAIVVLSWTAALASQWDKPWYWKDVQYVPTPQVVVDAMLEVAKVTDEDVVYDLGSGDGRIVITAARRFGAHAVGIDHDPRLIERARRRAREASVADLVTFRREDLFEADFSEATVVAMYLTPKFMKKLSPRLLEQLAPGTRIVSHKYRIPGWTPLEKVKVKKGRIYLYILPVSH